MSDQQKVTEESLLDILVYEQYLFHESKSDGASIINENNRNMIYQTVESKVNPVPPPPHRHLEDIHGNLQIAAFLVTEIYILLIWICFIVFIFFVGLAQAKRVSIGYSLLVCIIFFFVFVCFCIFLFVERRKTKALLLYINGIATLAIN